MNVVTRGIKNATRSPLKSGAIVLMFAISIALILSMLVARGSVQTKIDEVKANSGTAITISPAGVMGGMGGGDPLTADQIATIAKTANVSSTTSTLTDQMTTDDTNLTSSLELGAFGRRQERTTSTSTDTPATATESTNSTATATEDATRPAMRPRITVTGTTDFNSVSTNGSALNITSGATINAESSDNVALIGSNLAAKNSLSVGSTFTAYGQTVTVKGIYKTDNTFQDSGIIMPLATVQTLTNQAGAVSSVKATVNSSENVSATVTALETALGDKADITSEAETAAASVSSLEGIASLTLAGVIASAAAGAFIVILMMFLVVRERRREIGIIKAIGGSNAKVIGQFIVEGLSLTIIGAIIGIVFGVLVSGPMTTSLVTNSQNSTSTSTSQQGQGSMPGGGQGFGGAVRGGFSQLNTNVTQVTASLTPQIFFSAIGITLLIALLGSAIPAWLTSRVLPAEVLRTE